jgi:uncharacterized protein YdcH (DUF465 family)
MITKLFIPIPEDGNYDLLDKIYQLARKYGFCDTNQVIVYKSKKIERIQQLKEIVKGNRYLTIGFHPDIPSDVSGHRYQWVSQFKKNSFQDFEKMTTDLKEIKEWIIKNGYTKESLIKKYNQLHLEVAELENNIEATRKEALDTLRKDDYIAAEAALLTRLSFIKQVNIKLDEMVSILTKLKEIDSILN